MSEKKQTTPEEAYGMTINEQLYDRVSHERFKTMIDDAETRIHQIQVSANNYGEFLFVTTSRTHEGEKHRLTFWGLGYHEYRERWISQEWFWYRGYENKKIDDIDLERDEIDELLRERIDEIAPHISESAQSQRGILFEMLADLTDEDGALSELDDLNSFIDQFEEQ